MRQLVRSTCSSPYRSWNPSALLDVHSYPHHQSSLFFIVTTYTRTTLYMSSTSEVMFTFREAGQ